MTGFRCVTRGSLGGTIDSDYHSLVWEWIEGDRIEGFQL